MDHPEILCMQMDHPGLVKCSSVTHVCQQAKECAVLGNSCKGIQLRFTPLGALELIMPARATEIYSAIA